MRAEHRPVPPAPPPPGPGVAGQWPLRSFLELGALPGAVPCARLHARELMWEWRLTGLGDDVEILVSELVTNAVAASRPSGWQTAWPASRRPSGARSRAAGVGDHDRRLGRQARGTACGPWQQRCARLIPGASIQRFLRAACG